jgi:hypothetical protein
VALGDLKINSDIVAEMNAVDIPPCHFLATLTKKNRKQNKEDKEI